LTFCIGVDLAWSPRNANGGFALQVRDGGARAVNWREGLRDDDLLDSLFCAYVAAYCWQHGPSHYEVFGDVQAGHILVPIPPEQRSRLGLSR
jgi:predicted RNase H-like nuclease